MVACAAMKRSNPIVTTVNIDAATEKVTEKYDSLQVINPKVPDNQCRPTVRKEINTSAADEALRMSAIAMLSMR